VIGEGFFLFVYYLFYFIIFLFFFVFPQTKLLVHLGYWGFAFLNPNSVKDMHPELCGDVTDNGCGGLMESGGWSRIKCLGL